MANSQLLRKRNGPFPILVPTKPLRSDLPSSFDSFSPADLTPLPRFVPSPGASRQSSNNISALNLQAMMSEDSDLRKGIDEILSQYKLELAEARQQAETDARENRQKAEKDAQEYQQKIEEARQKIEEASERAEKAGTEAKEAKETCEHLKRELEIVRDRQEDTEGWLFQVSFFFLCIVVSYPFSSA